MAIQKNFSSINLNMDFENAYYKIDNININNKIISYQIEIYPSIDVRNNGNRPIDFLHKGDIHISELDKYEGDNIIAKLYNISKIAIPEFQQGELLDV